MNKKIFIIVLTAVAITAAAGVLWWWFLNRQPAQPANTGTFGTGQDKDVSGAGSGAGGPTNIGNPVAQNVGAGGISGAGIPGGSNNGGPGGVLGTLPPGRATGVASGQTGVVWVSPPSVSVNAGGSNGTATSNTGGAGTVFNPTPINGVRGSNPTGGVIPTLGGTLGNGQQNNGLGVGGAVIGAAAAGAISCGAAQAFDAAGEALGLTAGTAAGVTATAAGAGAAAADTAARAAISVQSIDLGPTAVLTLGTNPLLTTIAGTLGANTAAQTADNTVQTFWGCLARNVAKIALQQLTNSVVNWINSGFNGSPSFVQNQSRFLQNTADNIAGAYIQSSALAFLCSPFQLQIKIAIAQSYASREAQSCTLTQVVSNIDNFMNGDFASGGWPGMLSFTTIPTNNPYGAFAYATVGLQTAVQTSVTQKINDLIQGNGFLSFQQKTNCSSYGQNDTLPSTNPNQSVESMGDGVYQVCDLQTTTPGHVIADSIDKTLGESQDSLNLAKDFDEIISALISQLMTNALQGGLSNLSNNGNGYSSNYYTPDQQAAMAQSQTLITQMQHDTGVAQQYGSTEQGSIGDVQNAESQLQGLVSCWNTKAAASTTDSSGNAIEPDPARAATAKSNASAAQGQLDALTAKAAGFNANITTANGAIALLEQLQSRALSAGSMAEITAITQDYSAAQAQGKILTQANLTTAQQNRTTLQSQMAALSQQATTGLEQCNAFN